MSNLFRKFKERWANKSELDEFRKCDFFQDTENLGEF